MTETNEAKKMINNVLKPLEQHLMDKDPVTFQRSKHDLSHWIDFAVVKALQFGLPLEARCKRAKTPPNLILFLIFQVAKDNSLRLEALLEEAKERDPWEYIFGPTSCTVKIVITPTNNKNLTVRRPRYIEIVKSHGSVMCSMGLVQILG